MSSELIAEWHPSYSVFSFSYFEAIGWKGNLNLIFCNRFFIAMLKPRGAQYIFFSFSLVFFLRIFLTPDTFSFKFYWAVIVALTSSLERRGIMPLGTDASGTLQGSWQGLFPRLWSRWPSKESEWLPCT